MARFVNKKTEKINIPFQLMEGERVLCNGTGLQALFEVYNRNELLDQGREYIRPYIPVIEEQYKKLSNSKKKLLIELSLINDRTGERSTITFCRNTTSGYYSQMIINDHPKGESTNPVNTLKLLLFALPLIRNDSYQCGFQEKTNYTNNMFGFRASDKAAKVIGKQLCETIRYQYMRYPKEVRDEKIDSGVVDELSKINRKEFVDFLERNRSRIFVETENLNDCDLKMERLNEDFRNVGSFRTRKILLAYDVTGKIPVAVTITYRSPLRNFRGLCNQTYLIVDPGVDAESLRIAVQALMNRVCSFYEDFPLSWFPVLVTKNERPLLESSGAKFDLEFCNFYAKQDPRIFDYFEKLFRDRLERLERRMRRNS